MDGEYEDRGDVSQSIGAQMDEIKQDVKKYLYKISKCFEDLNNVHTKIDPFYGAVTQIEIFPDQYSYLSIKIENEATMPYSLTFIQNNKEVKELKVFGSY